MTNNAQWPSFDNLSASYAERAKKSVQMLVVPTIFLQRWWRQRMLPRKHQRLLPIIVGGRAQFVRESVSYLNDHPREDSLIKRHVFAFEKLDGTNVGVRCDGAVFGRRQQINDDSYQRTPLKGIIPDETIVKKLKRALVSELSIDKESLPDLILYGELMCNPGRYKYQERGMGRRWYAFGVVLQNKHMKEDLLVDIIQESRGFVEKFNRAGFLATMSNDTGKITLRPNERLMNVFSQHGIPCIPLVAKGQLDDVCTQLRSKMMKNEELEGVVLCGSELLLKWKTGKEDASKGHDQLVEFTNQYSPLVRTFAGVNETMLSILTEVSGNTPASAKQKRNTRGKANINTDADNQPCSEQDLAMALESALTKFDSVESFFARDCRNEIMCLLIEEVAEDLGCPTPADDDSEKKRKYVEKYVKKCIGKAFGKWKNKNR